jgi:hypothetical protein
LAGDNPRDVLGLTGLGLLHKSSPLFVLS